MQVLLVEDGNASTSACSLEIKVGNFLDPPHLPGRVMIMLTVVIEMVIMVMIVMMKERGTIGPASL